MKIVVLILLLLLDFFSKKFIFNLIILNNFITVLPFLDLIHIHNYGIAFGLFAGILPIWLIVIITVTIVFFLVSLIFINSTQIEKWGFLLILAGAISNLVDRIMHKYVLDFIYLHYKDFYWPAFNFADIYITFGVLMILYQLFKEFNKKIIK